MLSERAGSWEECFLQHELEPHPLAQTQSDKVLLKTFLRGMRRRLLRHPQVTILGTEVTIYLASQNLLNLPPLIFLFLK